MVSLVVSLWYRLPEGEDEQKLLTDFFFLCYRAAKKLFWGCDA